MQWRLKRGWKERLKNVIGGNNLELMESLCHGTKGDYDTGRRRGHFEATFAPSFPPETQVELN